MRVVVALGGNALLRRGQPMTIENQRENVGAACDRLAPIAEHHELVISHGNGPQIGLLALEEAAYEEVADAPLDVLGAETQGMIGYLDRAGAREPAAVREAARVAAHDDRGRPRRSGVRRSDASRSARSTTASEADAARAPSAGGRSSPTATACAGSCRRRRRSGSSSTGRSAGCSSTAAS